MHTLPGHALHLLLFWARNVAAEKPQRSRDQIFGERTRGGSGGWRLVEKEK